MHRWATGLAQVSCELYCELPCELQGHGQRPRRGQPAGRAGRRLVHVSPRLQLQAQPSAGCRWPGRAAATIHSYRSECRALMQAPPGAARSACRWVPVRTIEVPSDANFIDYAAMAYSYKLGKLAILSQENAAVWVRFLWCGCCCRHLGVPPASLSHHPGPLSLSSSFLIFSYTRGRLLRGRQCHWPLSPV